jgi:hypothetical protein
MYIRPTAPLPHNGVIEESIRLYRESFRRCVPIALLASLVSAAFGFFVLSYSRRAGLGLGPMELLDTYSQPPIMAASLLQSVLSLAFYGALIVTQYAIATGNRRMDFAQALRIGFTRLGRAVIAAILSTCLIVIGLILLLVPGFYYLGALCLWPVAIYADDAGAVRSVNESRKLIRGHWWRSSSILSVALLVVLVLSIITGVAAGLVAALWRADAADAQMVMQFATALANIVVLPMVPASQVALYQDLKLRLESAQPPAARS